MTAIVIIIENVRGSVSAETVRLTADAVAMRWGGECTHAAPIIDTTVPQAVTGALHAACARNATRRVFSRIGRRLQLLRWREQPARLDADR